MRSIAWWRPLLPLIAVLLLATACEQISEFAGIPSNTVEAVEVNVAELRLTAGEKYRLRAWGRMTDGNTRWSGLTWTSSDQRLGLVDANGMVTALAEAGRFTITAELDGKVAETTVWLLPHQEPCLAPAADERIRLEVGPMQLLQATEIGMPTIPAVTGQPMLVRVPVQVDSPGPRNVPVEVSIEVSRHGTLLGSLSADGPACLSPTPQLDSLEATFNAWVPQNWLRGDLELQATVEHSVPGVTPGRLASHTRSIRVVEPPELQLVLVPVDLPRLGTTSPFREHHVDNMLDLTRDLFPLDGINARMREPYTSQAGADLATVMVELAELRLLDEEQAHYYGMVDALETIVAYAGKAQVSGYIGMGLLQPPYEGQEHVGFNLHSATGVLAHELGHNFGRHHTPCGGAGGPESGYPYVGGFTGAFGVSRIWYALDMEPELMTPEMLDLMGYCGPRWISDHTYEHVLNWREQQERELQNSAAGTGSAPALLVSGMVTDGLVTLRPAFLIDGGARPPEAGDWTWQLLDVAGNVLMQTTFTPTELSAHDAPPQSQFVFSIPVDLSVLARAAEARVLDATGRNAGARELQAADGLQNQQLGLNAVRHGEVVSIDWNHETHSAIIIRDAGTGLVLGRGDSGSMLISTAVDELRIELSNGLSSTTVNLTVQPGR